MEIKEKTQRNLVFSRLTMTRKKSILKLSGLQYRWFFWDSYSAYFWDM